MNFLNWHLHLQIKTLIEWRCLIHLLTMKTILRMKTFTVIAAVILYRSVAHNWQGCYGSWIIGYLVPVLKCTKRNTERMKHMLGNSEVVITEWFCIFVLIINFKSSLQRNGGIYALQKVLSFKTLHCAKYSSLLNGVSYLVNLI